MAKGTKGQSVLEQLRKLSKEELVELMRSTFVILSISERDIRRVRHDFMCRKANKMADEAQEECSKNRGFENYSKYKIASRKFDRAMKLYERASEILAPSLERD